MIEAALSLAFGLALVAVLLVAAGIAFGTLR